MCFQACSAKLNLFPYIDIEIGYKLDKIKFFAKKPLENLHIRITLHTFATAF